jgi:hypothetical protein
MPRPSKSTIQRRNALAHVKNPGRKKKTPESGSDESVEVEVDEGGVEVAQSCGEEKQPEDGFRGGPRGGTSRWTRWRLEKKQRNAEYETEPDQARVSGLTGDTTRQQAGRPDLPTMPHPDSADMTRGHPTPESAEGWMLSRPQVQDLEKGLPWQDGALCKPVL